MYALNTWQESSNGVSNTALLDLLDDGPDVVPGQEFPTDDFEA